MLFKYLHLHNDLLPPVTALILAITRSTTFGLEGIWRANPSPTVDFPSPSCHTYFAELQCVPDSFDPANHCEYSHPSLHRPLWPLLVGGMQLIKRKSPTKNSMRGNIVATFVILSTFLTLLMGRYEKFFFGANDKFEVQRGLNNVFAYDLVPSIKVIESALRACRRGISHPSYVILTSFGIGPDCV
jgi:hypothetical protein